MVLEKLFETKDLLRSHGLLFLYTAIVGIIAMITFYFLFGTASSLLIVAFITIAFSHFIHGIYRGAGTDIINDKKTFLGRYELVIKSYAKIFIALTLVFGIVYAVVPQDVRVTLFSDQISALHGVSELKESLLSTTGNFSMNESPNAFNLESFILINNLQVLLSVIVLSFLYGAGAIFLIGYQSSILGAILGENIINIFGQYNNLGIYGHFLSFLHGSYLSLGVLPHGVFEILAYFLGAVAGGIISASLIGHYVQTRDLLRRTIKDVSILILIAIVFLIIGAVIEGYLLVI